MVRAALLATVLACVLAPPLAAAELAPHRAVYRLGMGEARSGSAIVDVAGTMTLSMEKSCDGWILAIQRTMQITTSGGQSLSEDMRFAGWESLDGTRFRFASRTDIGADRQAFKGEASMPAAGGPGKAIFSVPEAKTVTLPEGTLFPLSHTAFLIARAEAGDRQVPRYVFDGTEIEGAQEAVAFVGPRRKASAPAKKELGPLVERDGWLMRLAVFGTDVRAAEPQFEIEFVQLDNGVATGLTLDFTQFTVLVDIESLEKLPTPAC